jgi:predicted lipid carrier protein YhbT
MAEPDFPILLARSSLTWAPATLLTRATSVVLRRIGKNHPRLFRNLAAETPRTVFIEPTDLPHNFVLRFGGMAPSLELVQVAPARVDAGVKGPLAALVAMLEGRLDGDALFFSRTIIVTGDSETVVTLRNLVDREGLDVVAAAAGAFGPFRHAAQRAVYGAERRLSRLHARLAAVHEALHAGRTEPRPVAVERTQADVNARLARLEARGRRVAAS